MQEKKLLRDALEALVVGDGKSEPGIVYDMFGKRCACCSWFNTISHQAEPKHNADCPIILGQQALASTTDETEMEKLVVWLKENQEYSRRSKWADTPTVKAVIQVGEDILDYITTQFGEEEGDA